MRANVVMLTLLLTAACDSAAPPEVGTTLQAVAGGTATSAHEAVVFVTTSTGLLCSGVLATDTHVLTTALCLGATWEDNDGCLRASAAPLADTPTVRFGADATAPDHTVAALDYEVVPPVHCHSNLAVLHLAEPVPLELATPRRVRAEAVVAGEPITLVGYDATTPDAFPSGVKTVAEGSVSCVGVACPGTEGTFQSEDAIACHGDGGSPALDGDGAVIGLTSYFWGNFCETGTGFVDVTAYHDVVHELLGISPEDEPEPSEPEPAEQTLQLGEETGGCAVARPERGSAPGLALFALALGLLSLRTRRSA